MKCKGIKIFRVKDVKTNKNISIKGSCIRYKVKNHDTEYDYNKKPPTNERKWLIFM